MKIDKNIVEHTAQLARLVYSHDEQKQLEKELSGILDYVDILKEADTHSTEPTNQVTELQNVYRTDEITENFTRDEMLKNVNKVKGEFVQVKKVL